MLLQLQKSNAECPMTSGQATSDRSHQSPVLQSTAKATDVCGTVSDDCASGQYQRDSTSLQHLAAAVAPALWAVPMYRPTAQCS